MRYYVLMSAVSERYFMTLRCHDGIFYESGWLDTYTKKNHFVVGIQQKSFVSCFIVVTAKIYLSTAINIVVFKKVYTYWNFHSNNFVNN